VAEKEKAKLCGAPTRSRNGTCLKPAGYGTNHNGIGACKFHGGSTPTQEIHAAREVAKVNSVAALAKLGVYTERDPQQELLRQVGLSAAYVDALAYQYELAYADWQNAPDAGLEGEAALNAQAMKRQLWDKAEHLSELWGRERIRSSKISKMAVDAGVAKRHVEIAERQGTTIFIAVQNVLVGLGLPQAVMQQAKQLLAGEFRRIAAEEAKDVTGS
jgi:hypothetical protein